MTSCRRSSTGKRCCGGRSSAVEAQRRSRGCWDSGKTRGGATRHGELGGGLSACRRAPSRRRGTASARCGSGELGKRGDVDSLHDPKGKRVREMRHDAGQRGSKERAAGTCCGGRDWWRTAAVPSNSGDEILLRACAMWRATRGEKERDVVALRGNKRRG